MKYSFLVCAYNAEKFLDKCLASLVNQTIDSKKYEIILINDGSTDKTVDVAKKIKGIKIVNQKNKGLPESRNIALDHSKGEWVLFVDADDYVSPNYLEEIDKSIQLNSTANFVKLYEKKEKKANKEDKKVQSNKIDDSIVSRAYNKKAIGNYRFPGQFKYAIEDWDFYVHNFAKLISIDMASKKDVYYFYRYNEGSLSKSKNIYLSRFQHALSIFENPELRKLNLDQGIIGHYWEHLYMVARLWFPELMDRVKATKYKTKISFSIRAQYIIVKIGIFNKLIRKTGKAIYE